MTLWWCEYCLENHEKAEECNQFTAGGMSKGQFKSYNRRLKMHAKNPPKSGCVVVLFVAASVPVGIWWYFA